MATGSQPLKGKRILVTRAKSQVEEFMTKIEAEGGIALPAPLLEVKANIENENRIKETIHCLEKYDCIVFTSANGVTFFKYYLDKWEISYRNLKHLISASVGRKTSKQMEQLGLSVSIIPEEFVAEKLVEQIVAKLPLTSRILVIRGNLARPALVEGLQKHGYEVNDLIVYKTIHNQEEADKLKKYVKNNELDYITFTSSSTVDSFMKIFKEKGVFDNLHNIIFICIGPITYKTLKEYGLKGYMAASYTIEDMIKLMVELEQNKEDL